MSSNWTPEAWSAQAIENAIYSFATALSRHNRKLAAELEAEWMNGSHKRTVGIAVFHKLADALEAVWAAS